MTDTASSGRSKIITGIITGMVTGLFRDRDSAERAYQAALERGYDKSDINVLMSDQTRNRYFAGRSEMGAASAGELASKATEPDEQQSKGAALGGPAGGTAGTIAPAIAAAGALMLIPGLTIVGPVAIALAAAGAVGIAGGLIGALTDWGVPKKRLEEYEAGIREGGILLGVKPRSEKDAAYLEERWRDSGGESVHT